MSTARQKTPTVYESEKLTFCAYLVASGKAQLVDTKPTGNGRQVAFLLSYAPTKEEIAEFFSGSATVSALRYSEAMSTLKSAAYEGIRRNGRF